MPSKMDPSPEQPQTDTLLLDQPSSTAPLVADRLPGLAAEREQVEVKPLRGPKEAPPVADSIDPQLVIGEAAKDATVAVAPPGPPIPPQSPSPAAAAPPPAGGVGFDGGADNGTSIPPDTAGAVGPRHVFNPLNNNVSIFDRTGGPAAPVVSLNRFWSGLGITGNTFDPRAVFDPSFGGRYVFVTMADAQSPTSSLLVAASTTDDPTQSFVSHAIQVDDTAQGAVWFDFPSVGFTSDKITIQINLFTRADNRFAGSTVYAIDKATLYTPPHQATVQRFILRNKGATQVPAVTHDPGVADQYLVGRWGGNIQGQGFLVVYKLSGNVALGTATLTQLGFLATPQTWDAFPPGDIGPQTGTPRRVAVGDDRMLSVCLRDGRLYCCHAVMLPAGGPARSAVQWWEIDTATWAVLQVGRIDDPTGAVHSSAPSLAVNARGDLLIGHARFSAGTHPSGAHMLRLAGGAQPSSTVFAPGRNTYFKTFSGTTNRWGDYSHSQVDPVNDIDFWTVQEYAGQQPDTWATRWAQVVPPPVLTAGVSTPAAAADQVSTTVA
jgi:hypothetical protein